MCTLLLVGTACAFGTVEPHATRCEEDGKAYIERAQGSERGFNSTVLHVKDDPHLPCSATKKFHSITHTIQTQHCSCTPQLLHTVKPDHICHAQYSNHIAATHNTTPCTLKCTTHPPLPTPLPSTTLLCPTTRPTAFHNPSLHTTNKHISGGKMAQDEEMV